MKTVYAFPNGFAKEAESTYGWLLLGNLEPRWGPPPPAEPGGLTIELSERDAGCLVEMAKAFPARFGNASEIERRMAGDLTMGAARSGGVS